MIIEKVIIENYKCYYGIKEFKFTNGLNIILGENQEGKTKFFEALEWLFNGRESNIESILSMKRKSELNIDDICRVKVKLLAKQYNELRTLERSVTFEKKEDGLKTISNEFSCVEENKKGERSTVDASNLLFQLFPAEIRRYSMFKGETELNIFSNEEALAGLINLFAEAKHYQKYPKKSDFLLKQAEQAVDKETRNNNKREKEKRKLISEIENKKREIEFEKTTTEESDEEIEKIKVNIEKIERVVDNAEKLETINNKISGFDKRIHQEQNALKEMYNTYLFDDKYILVYIHNIFENFSNKVRDIEKSKRKEEFSFYKDEGKKEGMKESISMILGGTDITPLPKGVPEKDIMKEMLDDEWCKVCNRQAKKGSEAYEFMKRRLDDYLVTLNNKEEKKDIPFKYDYISELVNKKTLLSTNQKDNIKIKDTILELFNFNKERLAKIKSLEQDRDKQISEKEQLIGSSEHDEEKMSSLLTNYRIWQSSLVNKQKEYDDSKDKLFSLEKELNELKSGKDRLDRKYVNSFLIQTREILRVY
ncbi:MAG: AAA family ATPase [Bacteroidales bacterium]|nr:AAA family ATPase [Bacteroidales bacterium]